MYVLLAGVLRRNAALMSGGQFIESETDSDDDTETRRKL